MTMTTEDLEILERMKAFTAGKEWAMALKVGDLFMGAMPAALDRGYPRESINHKMFVIGALEVLEGKRIVTNLDRKLIEYK